MEHDLSDPQPSLFHRICAVVLILESLALAGSLIPGLIYLEVCFTFTSVLFLPGAITLAIQQYRGTFRRIPSAAAWACGLSCVPLSVLTMLLLVGFASLGTHTLFLLWCALLWIAQSAIVLSNWKWLSTLNAAAKEGWHPSSDNKFTLSELALLVAGVAIILAVGVPQAKPLRGISVPASATPLSLPEGAYSVTYDVASYYKRYECTVDEASFLKWYEQRSEEAPLKPIEEEERVLTLASDSFDLEYRIITDGWYYRWRKGDQGLFIAFDRESGRLYYSSHTR